MKRSYIISAAFAVAALSSAFAAAATIAPDHPGWRSPAATSVVKSQETTAPAAAALSGHEVVAGALFTAPLASKPAHGGYPGHVITHTGTVRGYALRSFPLANQPGYAKPAWRT